MAPFSLTVINALPLAPRLAIRPVMREAGQLLAVSLALALACGWWRLHHGSASAFSDVERIDIAAARALPAVLWVDARSRTAYVHGRIAGAVSDPAGDGDAGLERVLAAWTGDAPIVVYCHSDACDAASDVAHALRADLPGSRVLVLAGGWSAWQASP